MGREAQVDCTVGGHTERARISLESTALMLRGPTLRHRFQRAALQQLQVKGQALHFIADGHAVALALGAARSTRWLQALQSGPPSLAAKLGLSSAKPALVRGRAADDAALAQALHQATTSDPQAAAMLLVVALSADDLTQAVAAHAGMASPILWVVHVKGRAAALGDAAIRTELRARGYVDNKVSAVSDHLTATRYRRPAPR